LIAPLDWGLGHISRTIPLIELLHERGHEVITCGNKISNNIYKKEFPEIKHIEIQGYKPYYSKNRSQKWALIKQIPKFIKTIYSERKIAEEISFEEKADIIISDNRFGFRSSKTLNIYITHQLKIKGPLLLIKIVNQINRLFIQNFDHCWVPDFENSMLSGELSQSGLEKTFIGPLTRFKKTVSKAKKYKFKYLAIISGLEPQRSLLEDEIQNCFRETNQHCAIINGLTSTKETSSEKISFYPHLETTAFKELLTKSELVICRSGYSSIMDLYILQKKVLFIPTPGQTEQEYLAKHHQKTHSIYYQKQGRIDLKKANFNFIQSKSETKKKLLKVAFDKVNL
tara:strand:+ start:607 stop:1629 length:1023 start_codon:yes stop_codon:yes gene_type:complete